MSEKDGLFENPNQNEELDIEQQKKDTLREIKEDTSSILDVLTNFGGRQIDLLAQAEKQAKAHHLSDKRNNEDLIKALKAPKTVEKVRSENLQKSSSATEKKQAQHSPSPRKSAISPSEDNTETKRRKTAEKVKSENPSTPSDKPISLAEITADTRNTQIPDEQAHKEQKQDAEILPNGWKRDKDSRVRDNKGRYVKEEELAKHGIKNPPTDDKNSAEETEDLARDSALLDSLKDIKEAVQSPDNLDPIIDGMKEVTAPFGVAFDIGKTVVGATGRGFGKLFGAQNKEQRWRDRILNRFTKFAKKQEKSDDQQTSWLKRIWKKPNGPSLLGRMFGGVGGLFGGGLFGGGLGLLGGAARMGGSMLGGLLGSAGKLGKGFLKKIPVLGALFALGDGIGGLFDDSRDENGQSNRGKRVGSGVGTAVGGLVGSIFGPVGTIAGAMIGDWLGEKIGAWAADFDWGKITGKISNAWNKSLDWIKSTWDSIDWASFTSRLNSAWDNAKNWITTTWNSIDWNGFSTKISEAWDVASSWIKNQWDNIDWTSFSKKVGEIWDDLINWIKNTWDKLDFSGAWETTKNVAGKVYDAGAIFVDSAVNSAKSAGRAARNWVSDKFSSTYDTVSGWFFRERDNNKPRFYDTTPQVEQSTLRQESVTSYEKLDNIEGAEKTQAVNSVDNLSLLENIKNILSDTLLLWREWVGNSSANNPNNISNGHPSTLGVTSTWNGLSDTSGVSLISGAAVDPKTGKPLHYTNAEFKGGTIDGLSEEETAHAMNALSARESSGNFQSENQFGYIGGYQFGGEALADLGYVNKQKWQAFRAANKGKNIYSGGKGNSLHAQFLNDPSNWNIAGGKQTYLNSKQLQDESAVKLMNNNIRFLKSKGVQLNNAGDIVGAGFASHLKGAGNALKLLKNGKDSRDANGTSTSYYAQLGRNAMADSKVLSANTITIPTPIFELPKTENISGMTIPQILPPKDRTFEIIQQVERETEKKSTALQSQTARNTSQNVSRSPDPVLQFLTQDVSDRRIAHIVTGGIAHKGRI